MRSLSNTLGVVRVLVLDTTKLSGVITIVGVVVVALLLPTVITVVLLTQLVGVAVVQIL